MKKFLIITAVLLCLGTLLVVVGTSPFWLYWGIVNGKLSFDSYRLPDPARLDSILKAGEKEDFSKKVDHDSFENKYWKQFHILSFKIPLPLNHPQFLTGPIINEDDYRDYLQLGMRFYTQDQKIVNEIYFNEGQKFVKQMDGQKFFLLPMVKTFLERKELAVLWTDLFTKDLSHRGFWEVLHFSIEEMVYNLYLIHLRLKFFPKDMINYFYYDKFQMGAMELPSPNAEMKKEVCMFLVDGIVESYVLYSGKGTYTGQSIRYRMMDSIFYSPSFVDETKTIYEEFRELTYQSKIAQEGMLFLFSAWSHNTHDKEFLREIIGHLERGEGNLAQLHPLYIYAFKHYGDQFSGKRDPLKELKEKIKEEDKKEISKEKNSGTVNPDEFENREEKMKFFLQKAKEKAKEKSKTKGPSSEDSLIFD